MRSDVSLRSLVDAGYRAAKVCPDCLKVVQSFESDVEKSETGIVDADHPTYLHSAQYWKDRREGFLSTMRAVLNYPNFNFDF